MIHCNAFVENEAMKLLKELKVESKTYGELRQTLDTIPINNSFGFVVRRTKELLEKEISTIVLDDCAKTN